MMKQYFDALRHRPDIGTSEWDFTTDANGQMVHTAGCDFLRIVGDKVETKNAFRKQR